MFVGGRGQELYCQWSAFFSHPTPPQPRVRAVWGRKNAGGMPQGPELPFAVNDGGAIPGRICPRPNLACKLPVDDWLLRAVLKEYSQETAGTPTERGFPMSFSAAGIRHRENLAPKTRKIPMKHAAKRLLPALNHPRILRTRRKEVFQNSRFLSGKAMRDYLRCLPCARWLHGLGVLIS